MKVSIILLPRLRKQKPWYHKERIKAEQTAVRHANAHQTCHVVSVSCSHSTKLQWVGIISRVSHYGSSAYDGKFFGVLAALNPHQCEMANHFRTRVGFPPIIIQ